MPRVQWFWLGGRVSVKVVPTRVAVDHVPKMSSMTVVPVPPCCQSPAVLAPPVMSVM